MPGKNLFLYLYFYVLTNCLVLIQCPSYEVLPCMTFRYPHIEKDHLVKLLKQLLCTLCGNTIGDAHAPNAADVPTLLGSGSFSLLNCM